MDDETQLVQSPDATAAACVYQLAMR